MSRVKKGVLRNFAKFSGKHRPLFESLFQFQPTTLLKKRLWHRCFPANVAKFLRTPCFQNTFGRLLLSVSEMMKTAEQAGTKMVRPSKSDL